MLDTVKASPDAQAALSRMDARQGYRPSQIALGVAQPILAYPQLVDLANTPPRAPRDRLEPLLGGALQPRPQGPPAGAHARSPARRADSFSSS